jgi:HEAT repeat protein
MFSTRVPTRGAAPRLHRPRTLALGLFFTVLAAASAAPSPALPPAPGDSVAALRELLTGDGGAMSAVAGATWAGDVVTFTTKTPHGLTANNNVAVSGVVPAEYNVKGAVKAVPSPTTFTMSLPGNPGPYMSGGFVRGLQLLDLIDTMELEELSRVLLLQDWRNLDSAIPRSDAAQRRREDDAQAREAAAVRFRQKAKEAMKAAKETPKGSDPQARSAAMLSKAATADLIGETAAAGRKLDYLTLISGSRNLQGTPSQIGYLAQQLSDLTPDLIDLAKLNDPNGPELSVQGRLSATRALGQIQPADPAQVVGALALILGDEKNSLDLRIAAAESMDHLAQAASEEMQRSLGLDENVKGRFLDFALAVWQAVLQQGLAVGQPVEVRRSCLHAFNRIATEMLDISVIPEANAPASLELKPEILREIQDQATRYNHRLLGVFAVFEKNAEPLAAAVRDPDPEVRQTALLILVDLANVRQRLQRLAKGAPAAPTGATPGAPAPPTGKEAKPEAARFLGLTVALIAPDAPAKEKADTPLLDPLAKGMEKTMDALKQQLHGPDPQTRRAALDVLEILGDAAFPAVDALTQALHDPDRFVRWAAARTLGDLARNESDQHKYTDAQAEAAAVGIGELLRDQDVGVRLAAATALARFGPRARPAAPILIATLNHSQTEAALRLTPTRYTERELVTGDPTVRIAAFHALQAIDGDTAVDALPEAVIALGDHSIPVRQAAAEMIGREGVKASESYRAELVKALGKALADPEGDVRRAASGALLHLMPPNKK